MAGAKAVRVSTTGGGSMARVLVGFRVLEAEHFMLEKVKWVALLQFLLKGGEIWGRWEVAAIAILMERSSRELCGFSLGVFVSSFFWDIWDLKF